MVIQERKIFPYNIEAIPIELNNLQTELDRLNDPNFEPIESNCEKAMQLGLAMLGIKTSLRAREGYHNLGEFVADYDPEHEQEFFAKARPGYVLYTESKKRIYPNSLIEREQLFHPVIIAGATQDYVAQTLAASFSLRLDGYPPYVQLIFHATHKVKDGIGNAVCFWTFEQLQEDYKPKRLRNPKT